MAVQEQLISLIRRKTSRSCQPSVRALADYILTRYGDAAQAILFYGSCLRTGVDSEGIVDMYLLVDGYCKAYQNYPYAFLNKILPPNVFYINVPFEGRMLRAKYAVFSLGDFRRGTSKQWFHSYLWARLAQPVGIVYVRNDHIASEVYNALAEAVITFVGRALPLVPKQFTARELWCKGLELSYGAELRAERPDKLVGLFETDPHYYEELTEAVIALRSFSIRAANGNDASTYQTKIHAMTRISSRFLWNVRRIHGKILSILRLLKGLCTFHGGLSYILWKIERHSGVTVKLDPRLRRIPLVGVGVLFWRLYRRGAFR